MDIFGHAKQAYENATTDVESALATAAAIPVSIQCWQGDDVKGFDTDASTAASGGIQATGQYPGRARNFSELTADFAKACEMIPGRKRINLHASYAVAAPGEVIERDNISFRHFVPWVDFAREMGLGIDFNPTCFGHARVKDGLTLSSPDEATRQYWVAHCRRAREIAQAMGDALDDDVLCNLWIPDGFKDTPADRLGPRQRLRQSLDEIFAAPLPRVVDSVESKVFGIGLESYTVGSNEFYLAYTAARNQVPGLQKVYPLLDNGHFHPTENTADKIAALLCFYDTIPLHLTRAVRWDSDHVPRFDDELREICAEIVRNDALARVRIGLDFFDASINRVAAWVVGARNVQKALLYALLTPHGKLKATQDAGDFTSLLVISEDMKTLPFGIMWDQYCDMQGVPRDGAWLPLVQTYEAQLSRQ